MQEVLMDGKNWNSPDDLYEAFFAKYSDGRELRGILLPRVLDGSQDSNPQEHYCRDPDPVGRYVHHVRAPNEPTEHDQESNGIERKRHRLPPLNDFLATASHDRDPTIPSHTDTMSSMRNKPLSLS